MNPHGWLRVTCHYCPEPATTKDHIVPSSWGGGGDKNLTPACAPCNTKKGGRAPSCQCQVCVAAVEFWFSRHLPRLLANTRPNSKRRAQVIGRAGWLRRNYRRVLHAEVLANHERLAREAGVS